MKITPDSISLAIGNKPATDVPQEARHEMFIIGPSLEMVQQVRVVALAPDGTSKVDEIKAMGLSPARLADAIQTFQDRLVTRETSGAFVDRTGKVLDPMSDTFDPDKAIPQKTFFQNVTLGTLEQMSGKKVNKDTKLSELIYVMLGWEISNLYAREAV